MPFLVFERVANAKHVLILRDTEYEETPTIIGIGDTEVENSRSWRQVLHQRCAVRGHAEHWWVIIDVQYIEVHSDGSKLASPVFCTDSKDVILLRFVVQRTSQVEDSSNGVQEEHTLFIIFTYGVRDFPVDTGVIVSG